MSLINLLEAKDFFYHSEIVSEVLASGDAFVIHAYDYDGEKYSLTMGKYKYENKEFVEVADRLIIESEKEVAAYDYIDTISDYVAEIKYAFSYETETDDTYKTLMKNSEAFRPELIIELKNVVAELHKSLYETTFDLSLIFYAELVFEDDYYPECIAYNLMFDLLKDIMDTYTEYKFGCIQHNEKVTPLIGKSKYMEAGQLVGAVCLYTNYGWLYINGSKWYAQRGYIFAHEINMIEFRKNLLEKYNVKSEVEFYRFVEKNAGEIV